MLEAIGVGVCTMKLIRLPGELLKQLLGSSCVVWSRRGG